MGDEKSRHRGEWIFALDVPIKRLVAAEVVLNDVEQNPIEAAPLPVIKIAVDLSARQLYRNRPRGVRVEEEGLASAISQKSSTRMNAKREAHSTG